MVKAKKKEKKDPSLPGPEPVPTSAVNPAPDVTKAEKKRKSVVKKEDKGPKKKKLTKKEKARLAAELAEQQRLEQERERARIIQEEKERIEQDRMAAQAKIRRDAAEQQIREVQVAETMEAFKGYIKPMNEMLLQERQNEEWTEYLKCDGLPDPASLSEMNTYLYLWRLDDSVNEIEAAIAKTGEVLGLLNVQEDLIDVPLDSTPEHVKDWKELRNSFRMEQQLHLDTATYRLLRVAETDLTLVGLHEIRYTRQAEHFTLCLWTLLPLPRPIPPPPEQPKPIKQCTFEELGISLQMPESLGYVHFVVRALQLRYDHFSDLCPSSDPPPLNPEKLDLQLATQAEWDAKVVLQHTVDADMEKRTKQRRAILAQAQASQVSSASGTERRGDNRTPPKSADKQSQADSDYASALQQIQDLPPLRTASDHFQAQENDLETELRNYMTHDCKTGELNLRRFCILGGVLHLDMLEQLPQPHELPEKYVITVLNVPRQLEPVDFHVAYTPPPPPEPGQRRLPEEIEAEMKKQEEALENLPVINFSVMEVHELGRSSIFSSMIHGSTSMNVGMRRRMSAASRTLSNADPVVIARIKSKRKFVKVKIKLPESVLWFEPPTVVRWDYESKHWSTSDCHDFKFNEEKQILSFRLGQFGPLGLAAYRYSNLPFQTWEMKPDLKGGGVLLSISAAVMIVEFIIKGDRVCLSQLQNGATNALQEIVGTFYKPHKLMKLMCRGGVNIFPDHDAFCYVEGCATKHRAAEDHHYHCMALLGTAFNFAWSRWNLLAGRRNMVCQMREYLDRKRLPNHSTLYVTPLKAIIVDCTEVSQAFNETGVPEMRFYSDLYHLSRNHATLGAKKKMLEIDFTLVETTYEMLRHTRVLSFS